MKQNLCFYRDISSMMISSFWELKRISSLPFFSLKSPVYCWQHRDLCIPPCPKPGFYFLNYRRKAKILGSNIKSLHLHIQYLHLHSVLPFLTLIHQLMKQFKLIKFYWFFPPVLSFHLLSMLIFNCKHSDWTSPTGWCICNEIWQISIIISKPLWNYY